MSTAKANSPILSDLLFAEKYDRHAAEQWFTNHRLFLFQAMGTYLVFVFVVRHYLKDRKAFELKKPLAVWDASLAVFSTIGFFKMLPAFFYSSQNNGITGMFGCF